MCGRHNMAATPMPSPNWASRIMWTDNVELA